MASGMEFHPYSNKDRIHPVPIGIFEAVTAHAMLPL